MTFDSKRRLMNQHVRMRDVTGAEHDGIVREVHDEVYILANGDGTLTIINRADGNVVSVRVLA